MIFCYIVCATKAKTEALTMKNGKKTYIHFVLAYLSDLGCSGKKMGIIAIAPDRRKGGELGRIIPEIDHAYLSQGRAAW